MGLLLAGGSAQARLIEDMEWRRDGADAVLQIRFVSRVQYLRSTGTPAGDQAVVFYRALAVPPAVTGISESRLAPVEGAGQPGQANQPGQLGLPGVLVLDDPAAPERLAAERRLTVRWQTGARARVRAGKNDHSIELVLPGRGTQVPGTPVVPEEIRITLDLGAPAGTGLAAAIPAALQHLSVYTTHRTVDGKVIQDTHIGPFRYRAEAETALNLLKRRFPDARVTTRAEGSEVAKVIPVAAPMLEAAVVTEADAASARDAQALLRSAQEAHASGAVQSGIKMLEGLLAMPPNPSSRQAQALLGEWRAGLGDHARARAEMDLFLRLYPQGEDADRVRAQLKALPAPAAEQAAAGVRRQDTVDTLTGSFSSFYYGGQSRIRTQDFADSPIGGLPVLVTEATLAPTDQRLVATAADLSWRHRDADRDQRFVFRDNHTKDLIRPDKTRNRLTALYYDHKETRLGTQVRVGRQSPLGGGVMGRFDGVQGSLSFQPKWRAGLVAGTPTDKLLDTRRVFYGASLEADALTPTLGGSVYLMEQRLDGAVDRRALGSELRLFDGGLSATAQLDYDLALRGLNVLAVQGNWQGAQGAVVNAMYDRRAMPMLSLGNALFFANPNGLLPRRLQDLLDSGATVGSLHAQVRSTTPMATQASMGITLPVHARWQMGADLRYTNVGAVAPVPDLLPQGLPSSGAIWGLGLQAIGSNLYSARDTHVLVFNAIQGPSFKGQLLSYNNSSLLWGNWQVEPSLRFYRQTSTDGTTVSRWGPGLRVSYRVLRALALESELNSERSQTSSALRKESASRLSYYLGGRYEF